MILAGSARMTILFGITGKTEVSICVNLPGRRTDVVCSALRVPFFWGLGVRGWGLER